jgi:hypothetical protein
MQISLAEKTFLEADNIDTESYMLTESHDSVVQNGTAEFFQINNTLMAVLNPKNNENSYFAKDFSMDLFFEDKCLKLVGGVEYNNKYENTIEGNLFVGHVFDERIFRPEFKESTFNFSIAIRKINKTIYPRVVGGKYKLDSLV